MKNLILTAIACVFLFQLNAQNSALILGVNGGTNLSKLSYIGDFAFTEEKTSRRLGFQGGLDVGFKFNNFSFITGFKYTQRGGKTEIKNTDANNPFLFIDGTFDTGTYSSKTRFANLSIPLLLRYQTSGKLAFSVSLGPVINRGLGDITTEELYELDNIQDKGPTEQTQSFGDGANDLFKSSGIGFVLSPGILYQIGDSGYFRVNLTIHSGGDQLNKELNVSDGLGGARKINGSIKSNALILEIGYEHRIDFNLGSKY